VGFIADQLFALKLICLTKDLYLVMTPPDDGWNKMFFKSPQNGLNENTLELAKMYCVPN